MSEMLSNETMDAAPLQELAAERLAAHRRRRYGFEVPTAAVDVVADEASQERCGLPVGAARVREAVAERYKHSVSYREFLAAEAERAVAQAQAQVEIATRNVAAVAAAQTKLMEELELWPTPDVVATASVANTQPLRPPTITAAATTTDWAQVTRQTAGHAAFYPDVAIKPKAAVMSAAAATHAAALPETTPSGKERPLGTPGLRVRLHEPVPPTVATLPRPRVAVESEDGEVELQSELQSLDEEIAFRAAPEFDEHLLEPLTIQPNILEFPRQLVAARRARPRLADGPLVDASPQLRIFEVETAAISVQPEVAAAAAPEWQSVVLDAPVRERVALPVAAPTAVKPELKHMAPVMLRLAALVIDVCWVGLAFVGVVCVAVKKMGTLPHLTPKQMAVGAAVSLLTLALVYGLVFLSLAGATPGMMYAEIGLYKFDTTDARPGTLRLWLLLTLLSALPAGLGLLWPVVDPDGLGWQDRVCRVYPRLV